ncbi:DUF2486 family protein [Pandoraea sputorum]|uniref:Protein of uncharacterized function (DUF2486) n=1 Tax=Pandoraea sputorum TaxID=93222 RepID=A0A239SNX1_9BURK|nr:DUF2486 family protein [Pandoraea sputorum]BET13695.1 hypothetical protein THI4931_47370 [Pandoraea sputorum]SNU86959.1 Protein of uncharacterised function (DUF2486) [Pandoraea sputorum]VVE23254.1 hypothetical protein PSP20601_03262 [Pandoraea sputorum]VVE78264.1 hypothetical protein PSP31120_01590 [Pandoraea sputorum]
MTNEPERNDPGIPTLTEVLAEGETVPSGAAGAAGDALAAAPVAEQGVPADVAVFAERVSARLTLQLADEITTMVERRCHDALIDQTSWLVQLIGKQVADALQAQLPDRIRQAVIEEVAKQVRSQG